ncbi:WecB/TagA/CpsF family glycosyltransferase [Luteolibacter pohnpeiensis]|uniref:WecB/TagA/CpsF family glycosyltransferase n=1 Tax=Luteolibacter pohnpeiensis TaxID=454153 RepID=A0A934SBH1_9BACT|nr:WecB/TagA/CpsF family glycosyltransferase [Luteolibacter pohnpeiensis]MBK1882849.1 WecB/TagA/CpsF family glycosyltransferase [Luteolibacter pohnpeiensis]
MTKTFLGIRFWNSSTDKLLESADSEGGLFTVPSAPSLAQMRHDPHLMESYQASDFAVGDGGYVALVLRLCFGRNLPRISGLQILQRLVGEKKQRAIPFHDRNILWVVPTPAEKERIDYYLEDQGFPRHTRHWYQAPFYKNAEDFNDEALAAKVQEVKPDWIILCIAGGKQEKLGLFLRKGFSMEHGAGSEENPDALPSQLQPPSSPRPNGPVILCTGGAIAFLTGGQANIPTWADRMYLGWLFRVFQSPKTFLPRYWNAGYEFPMLLWDKRKNLFQ